MRNILLISSLSLLLSSCYIEVTDSHQHNYEPSYNSQFSQLKIDSQITRNESILLAGYAMQLYTLSNQPHQLAFLSNTDNLLNDIELTEALVDGDVLGVQKEDAIYASTSNVCDYGYINITDYQQRIFDRITLNGETLDEFDADFSLYTSSTCEINHPSGNSPLILNGDLNYEIYFNNYINNSNSSVTDEIIASINGHWAVENDNLGYWDIQDFQSNLNYQRFDDNTVWTSFSSHLSVHDHNRQTEGSFNISTGNTLQTDLGIIHPYSGEIFIQDDYSHNQLEMKIYSDSVDIYINGRLLHQYIDWDDIISSQSQFDLN